jgi:hypothetical protein
MKYFVFDNEGYNFCEWGRESPRTRREIIEYFIELNEGEAYFHRFTPYKKEDFSLKMIESIWNVEILPIHFKQSGGA